MVAPVPVPIGEGPKEILAQHEVALACQHVVDDAWSRLSEVVTRVVDEEDGVFLYKLTRIAQAYPEVMQCVTERRAAVVASLQSQLDPVRTALVHRVKTALDDLSELQYEVWRKREAERNLAAAEKLDRQRLAASIELAHKDIEANLRMRKELRAKEKAWEQKLIAELDKVSRHHSEEVRRMIVGFEMREKEWQGRERRFVDQLEDLKARAARTASSLEAREKEVTELTAESEGLHALSAQLKEGADEKSRQLEASHAKLDAVRSSLNGQINSLTLQLSRTQLESTAAVKRADSLAVDVRRMKEANSALSGQNERLEQAFRQSQLDLDRSIGEAKDLGREVRRLNAYQQEALSEKAAALNLQAQRFRADKLKLLAQVREGVRGFKEKGFAAMRATLKAAIADVRRDVLAQVEVALRTALLDGKTGAGPRLDQLALEKAALQRELRAGAEAWRGRLDFLRRERDASEHISRLALRVVDGELGEALEALGRSDARAEEKVEAVRQEGAALMTRAQEQHAREDSRRAAESALLSAEVAKFERNYHEMRDRLLRARAELRASQDTQEVLERERAQLRVDAAGAEAWADMRLAWVREAAEADLQMQQAEVTQAQEVLQTHASSTQEAHELHVHELAEANAAWSAKLSSETAELASKLEDAELRAGDVMATQSHLRRMLSKEWTAKMDAQRAVDAANFAILEGALFDADASYPKLRREHTAVVRACEQQLAAAVGETAVAKEATAAVQSKLDKYLTTSKLLMTEEQAQTLYLISRTNAAKTGLGAAVMTIDEAARKQADSVRKQLDRKRLAAKRKAFAAQQRIGGPGDGEAIPGMGTGMRLFASGSAGARSPPRASRFAGGAGLGQLGAVAGGEGPAAGGPSAAGGGLVGAIGEQADGAMGAIGEQGEQSEEAEAEGAGEAAPVSPCSSVPSGLRSPASARSPKAQQPRQAAQQPQSQRTSIAPPRAVVTGQLTPPARSPSQGGHALSPGAAVGRARSPGSVRQGEPAAKLAAQGMALGATAARGAGTSAAAERSARWPRYEPSAAEAAAEGAPPSPAQPAAAAGARPAAAGAAAALAEGGGEEEAEGGADEVAPLAPLPQPRSRARTPPLSAGGRLAAGEGRPIGGGALGGLAEAARAQILALEAAAAPPAETGPARHYTGSLAGGGVYVSRLFPQGAADGGADQQPGRQRSSRRRSQRGSGGASGGGGVSAPESEDSSSDDDSAPTDGEGLDPTQADIATDLARTARRMVRMRARNLALEGQVAAIDAEADKAHEQAAAAHALRAQAEAQCHELQQRVLALESHFAKDEVALKQLEVERKTRLAQLVITAAVPSPEGEAALEQLRALPEEERRPEDWRELTHALVSEAQEAKKDFAALEQSAEAQAVELNTRIVELNSGLERLYHVVSEQSPQLLFRAAELEALLALRDSQIARLLEALHAQKRRVSSASDDLALALSLFPSLTQVLTAAHRGGEHRGLGAAMLPDALPKRKPRRGGNRSHVPALESGEGALAAEYYGGHSDDEIGAHSSGYGNNQSEGANSQVQSRVSSGPASGAEGWVMPERNVHSPSLGGLHAQAPALFSAAPTRRSTALPQPLGGRRSGSPSTPSRSSVRSPALDLRPIAPGNELLVTPHSANRPETVISWLASENAYGPSNAPSLRPLRPRTSVGQRSMSEHVLAASELTHSLKSVDGLGGLPAPSRLPCDRSFRISTPSVRANDRVHHGAELPSMSPGITPSVSTAR